MRPAAILFSFLGLWAAADACTCAKVSNPGLYCGYCTQVYVYDVDLYDNVYWCNKSGGCENLGYATNCKNTLSSRKYCDGRDQWKRGEARRNAVEDASKDVQDVE